MENTFKKLPLVTPQGQGRLEGIRSNYRKEVDSERNWAGGAAGRLPSRGPPLVAEEVEKGEWVKGQNPQQHALPGAIPWF